MLFSWTSFKRFFLTNLCFISCRFEAEISGSTASNNVFVPSQLRPIIGSNTYNQVQQKLQLQPPTISKPPTINQLPLVNSMPSTAASAAAAAASAHQHQHQQQPQQQQPSFMPTFMPQQNNDHQPEKSYSSEPTPVILSSAPKLYNNRPMSIQPNEYPFVHQAPQVSTSIHPSSQLHSSILLINVYLLIHTDRHYFDTIWCDAEIEKVESRKEWTESNCRGGNPGGQGIVGTTEFPNQWETEKRQKSKTAGIFSKIQGQFYLWAGCEASCVTASIALWFHIILFTFRMQV